MIKRHKRLIALAASPVLALGLVACGSDSNTSSDDANTLVLYSGRDGELVDPLVKKFEEKTGISVQVRQGDTPELAAQIIEEGENTPAQVFLAQDAGAVGAVAQAGLFSTLPSNITDRVDSKYTSQDGSWVGVTGRARVTAYDTQKVKEANVPGDVYKLTEPEWKGKVGIVPSNASFQAFVTAMRVTDGADKTQQWLDGLKANDAKIYNKNGELLEAVNAGAVELGLINHYYWARSEQDPKTLRAQIKFGDPGTISAFVNVTGAGILKNAANSSAANQFVEYLVSDEGQEYFVQETHEYPLVPGLPQPAGVPPLNELNPPDINLSDLASLEESQKQITQAGLL